MPPKAVRLPTRPKSLRTGQRAAKSEANRQIKTIATNAIRDEDEEDFKPTAVVLGNSDTSHVDLYDNPMDEVSELPTVTMAPVKRIGPSMQLKAIKAREKALVDKFAVVKGMIQNQLERDDGVVVDCLYLADEKSALVIPCPRHEKNSIDFEKLEKSFDYVHLVKLRSDNPFVLVKQALLTEGPYAGNIAIILKQSLPFPFLQLPLSIRAKVLSYVLKHNEEAVPMIMKQGVSRTPYSPVYDEKNCAAILATSKEIQKEAATILYGQKFHFPGTQVVAAFLLQIGNFRKYLVSIRSDTYNPTSARVMFPLLQDAKALQRLSFGHVSSNENPRTAVKNIFEHGQRWFLTIEKDNPAKGLDILRFDQSAFHVRVKDEEDQGKTVVQWGPGEQLEFLKGLRIKLEQAAEARKTRY